MAWCLSPASERCALGLWQPGVIAGAVLFELLLALRLAQASLLHTLAFPWSSRKILGGTEACIS